MTNKELLKDFRAYVRREVIPLGRPTKQEKSRVRLVFLGAFILFGLLLFLLTYIPEITMRGYIYVIVGIAVFSGGVYKSVSTKINSRRNNSSWEKALRYFKDVDYDLSAEETQNQSPHHKGHSLHFKDIQVRVTSLLKDPPSESVTGIQAILKNRSGNSSNYGMCVALQLDIEHKSAIKESVIISPNKLEKYLGKSAHKIQKLLQPNGKLAEMNHPEFEKKFQVYSKSTEDAQTVLDETIMKKMLKWEAAKSMKFVVSPTHISVIYKASHSRFGSDVTSEFEADNYKKYDPMIFYYSTARIIKHHVNAVFG